MVTTIQASNSPTLRIQRIIDQAHRAMRDNIRTRGVMSSPPTITADGTTVPAGQTLSRLRATYTTLFREMGGLWLGGTGGFYKATQIDPSTGGNLSGGAGATYWRTGAQYYANKVSFRLKGTTSRYRFIVDGQYVDTTGTLTSTQTNDEYISLDFTSAGGLKTREIWVEGQGACGFKGAYVGGSEAIFQLDAAPLTSVMLGDSYVYGSSATALGDGANAVMADYLGFHTSHRNAGSGGTGWLQTSGSIYTFGQRIANGDLLLTGSSPPDLAILQASGNDKTQTAAAITAEVLSRLPTVRAQCPYSPILVMGVWNANGFTGGVTSATNIEAAAAAAVTAFNDPYCKMVPICQADGGPFLDGTTGNLATNLMADTTHPSTAGGAVMGSWQARAALTALKSMIGA